jgi:hypothetical protein
LAIGAFTVSGMQKAIDQIVKYCEGWRLKCNLNKSKIIVFKKEGRLKKNVRWTMHGNNIEVVDGDVTIPRLLYADDLAIGAFTVNCMQKAIDQIVKYCEGWRVKFNLNKTKIIVFKKGGRLKKNVRWTMHGNNTEVVDEIIYLRITLENMGS